MNIQNETSHLGFLKAIAEATITQATSALSYSKGITVNFLYSTDNPTGKSMLEKELYYNGDQLLLTRTFTYNSSASITSIVVS